MHASLIASQLEVQTAVVRTAVVIAVATLWLLPRRRKVRGSPSSWQQSRGKSTVTRAGKLLLLLLPPLPFPLLMVLAVAMRASVLFPQPLLLLLFLLLPLLPSLQLHLLLSTPWVLQ